MRSLGFLFFVLLLAAHGAHAVDIKTNIPGSFATSSGPAGFVSNFYQFALMIGGLLAFGMIVYGGIKYAVAAGNPSGQSDAKDQITQALLGLLILVGAALILNIINPELLNLKLAVLQKITAPSSKETCPGGCPAPLTCQASPTGSSTCKLPLGCESCPATTTCRIINGQGKCVPLTGFCTPESCPPSPTPPFACTLEACPAPQQACQEDASKNWRCLPTCAQGCPKGRVCVKNASGWSCEAPLPDTGGR